VLTRDEWVLGGAVLMRAAAEWIRGTSQRHRTCPPAPTLLVTRHAPVVYSWLVAQPTRGSGGQRHQRARHPWNATQRAASARQTQRGDKGGRHPGAARRAGHVL